VKTKFSTLVNCSDSVYEFSNKLTEAAARIVSHVRSQSSLMTESIAQNEIELVLTGNTAIHGVTRKFMNENMDYIRDVIKGLTVASVDRRGDKFQSSLTGLEPRMFDLQRDAEIDTLRNLSQKTSLTPGAKITVIIDGEVMDPHSAMNHIRGKYYADGKPSIDADSMFDRHHDDEYEHEEHDDESRVGADSKDISALTPIKDRATQFVTGRKLLNDKVLTEGDEPEETEVEDEGEKLTAVDMINSMTSMPDDALEKLGDVSVDLFQSTNKSPSEVYEVVNHKFRELTGNAETAYRDVVNAFVEELLGDAKTEDDVTDVGSERAGINLMAMSMANKLLATKGDRLKTGDGAEVVKASQKFVERIKGTELDTTIGAPATEDQSDDAAEDQEPSNELDVADNGEGEVDLGLPTDTAAPGMANELPDADVIMSGNLEEPTKAEDDEDKKK